MMDLYAASKLGLMIAQNYNGSAGAAVRFKSTPPAPRQRMLMMIRCTTNCRVLQGGSGITVSATNGTLLLANEKFPMVIESEDDAYISLLSGTTASGTVELTLVSDVSTWTMAAA